MTLAREAPARQDTCRAVRPLTLRERQVVSLAALGHTNRAIAARLALTEEGVKSAMRKVFDKLGVTSRTAAATVAGSLGSLLPSEHLPAQPLIRVGIAPLSRVTKADLRDVVARWQGRAPAALLEELRGLLGEAS